MFLGLDIGTSGVKAVLVDGEQRILDQATAAIGIRHPRPLWSEQDPASWVEAAEAAMSELKGRRARELSGLQAIGLSGQMHGATLLDAGDRVLRPAILWNDGRAGAECAELERREPRAREITANQAMPGFTAPKLLWVAAHEPAIFRQVAKVLLPKDYVRLALTGEHVSDMSDSAGTLWLDVRRRRWSPEMLAATALREDHMPRLVEGSEAGGQLRREVAERWGVPAGIPVAGGGGDNAAGAVGAGVIAPGGAFLSLGTSGVIFAADHALRPDPERGVHAFCHALPGRWHQMAVMLSAASCLTWAARILGEPEVEKLVGEAEAGDRGRPRLLFLPYLTGERTPHNDPNAAGAFVGLTAQTERSDLVRAVLEGVAFALGDGLEALRAAGAEIGGLSVLGGGSRSTYWGRIIASVLGVPLTYHAGGDVGPAFGAARLARLAATGEDPAEVCTPRPVTRTIDPEPALAARYAKPRERFRALYPALKPSFSEPLA